jgi:exonuclease III
MRVPEEQRFSLMPSGKKILIDHISISKALESSVKSVQILNENIATNKNVPPTPSCVESDHAPIVVELA